MHCRVIQNRLTIYYYNGPVDEGEQDSTNKRQKHVLKEKYFNNCTNICLQL